MHVLNNSRVVLHNECCVWCHRMTALCGQCVWSTVASGCWGGCHGDSSAMIGSAFQGMIHTHIHDWTGQGRWCVHYNRSIFKYISTGAQANKTQTGLKQKIHVMLTLDLCWFKKNIFTCMQYNFVFSSFNLTNFWIWTASVMILTTVIIIMAHYSDRL